MKGKLKLTEKMKEEIKAAPTLDDLKLPELPWRGSEKQIAEKYRNEQCGMLHLQWMVEHYWGLVTRDIIIPGALAVHKALVKQGYTEKNPLSHNDMDNTAFYIPCKGKKVWVETSQNRDYLYIMTKGFTDDEYDLHIRRIFRDIDDNSYMKDDLAGADIKTMLQYADSLNDYHDDHYRYSHRPGLEAYRKVGFQIPYHPEDREKERDFYGDFRDGGYILSYQGWMAKHHPKVEGAITSWHELHYVATLYIPCLARELEIKVPQLSGYDY